VAFTKKVAKHDRIEIDGVDYSNAFRQFGFSSEHSTEDVSGFSVSGVDETLPGNTAQGFTGEMFYTEESAPAIWDLHRNKTICEIVFQPDGLVNPAATTYYANCTINQFGPADTRGSVSTMPFSATTADENGIQSAPGT
jgi:hypothetical protein